MRSGKLIVCCVALVAGCESSGDNDPRDGGTTTLRLEAQDDGQFESCDAAGDCRTLPNPNDCATLVIEIDNGSGEACETCLDASDAEVHRSCESPSVVCDVVTIPEPDCMVCAHVNGAIVYSSCVVPPEEISCYTTSDANESDPARPTGGVCTVCYDPAGTLVKSDCDPHSDCESDSDCGLGEQCLVAVYDCPPPVCDPDGNCEPTNCTGGSFGRCEPIIDCSRLDCPEPHCAEGYHVEYGSTGCCGACVPDEVSCLSSDTCAAGQHCSVEDGDCRPGCAPDMVCPDVCRGVCVDDFNGECTSERCNDASP